METSKCFSAYEEIKKTFISTQKNVTKPWTGKEPCIQDNRVLREVNRQCELSYMAALKTSVSRKQGRVVAVGVGDWQTWVWCQRVLTLHQNKFCRGC